MVHSALAAESPACTDCIEADIYWMKLMSEILTPSKEMRILHHVDSKSIIANLTSTKTVNDRLLRVDLNVVWENIDNHEIDVQWVSSENNVSDVRKSGVSAEKVSVP